MSYAPDSGIVVALSGSGGPLSEPSVEDAPSTLAVSTRATIPAVLQRSAYVYHLEQYVREFQPVGHLELIVVRDMAQQTAAMEAWNDAVGALQRQRASACQRLSHPRGTMTANSRSVPWRRRFRPPKSISLNTMDRGAAVPSIALFAPCWICKSDGGVARRVERVFRRTTSSLRRPAKTISRGDSIRGVIAVRAAEAVAATTSQVGGAGNAVVARDRRGSGRARSPPIHRCRWSSGSQPSACYCGSRRWGPRN